MQKGSLLAAVALLVVTGCARETIALQNPQTGQLATCGPYNLSGSSAAAQIEAAHTCVITYCRQGFERVQTD